MWRGMNAYVVVWDICGSMRRRYKAIETIEKQYFVFSYWRKNSSNIWKPIFGSRETSIPRDGGGYNKYGFFVYNDLFSDKALKRNLILVSNTIFFNPDLRHLRSFKLEILK